MTRSIETEAVHAGREKFRDLGIHAPPIDLSTTYPLTSLDEAVGDFDVALTGERPIHSSLYARLDSPTVDRFEMGLAGLERAEDAVAFSSGMAAMTAALLACAQHGRHVVAVRPLYGGTDHLLCSHLLGLDVTWAHGDAVAEAIRPDTSLVLVETPGNPTLTLVDIADVGRQAGPVPVLVDSTFATPILQQPLAFGAVFSLHSATKFLGGHGDVMAGVIATSHAWANELRKIRILTGALLHPLAAFLLHRSLPTLPLRVREAQATAEELARRLLAHPAVERVLFPGAPGCDPLGLVGRQMSGPGSVMSFEVGSFEAASLVMRSVELITPAVSLGSTDTLIEHPAGLTHRVLTSEARNESGIDAGLLRLAVGLESADDLWRDLAGALDRVARHYPRAGHEAGSNGATGSRSADQPLEAELAATP